MELSTLAQEQMDILDEMIQRRMDNTGESRDEACDNLANYFKGLISYKELTN
jgi:hypothetical protein